MDSRLLFHDCQDEDMDIDHLLTPISRKCERKNSEAFSDCDINSSTEEWFIRRPSRAIFGKSRSFGDRISAKRFLPFVTMNEPPTKRSSPGSFDTHQTMDALENMSGNRDLIGDGSAEHILPMISGNRKDLKSISSSTMLELMNGKYCDRVKNYVIVDCRYPYEYDGGHIKGAENLYTEEMVLDRFLSNPNKDTIIIFHCEFSSQRGPKMFRRLRQKDREVNADKYPKLHYPEIYLLDGGYKEFYSQCKEHCSPRNYVPMLHKDHTDSLRHFRVKSKSWHGAERKRCLRF